MEQDGRTAEQNEPCACKKIAKTALLLFTPLLLGTLAATVSTPSEDSWYASLNAPTIAPPNWVFGPVWTVLYLAMGYSLYRIWERKTSSNRKKAIAAFAVQMVLNVIWTMIFFNLQQIGLALAEIAVLWVSIVVMMLQFYKVDKVATYLNIPYLLWVTFATALNAMYYVLN